MVAVVWSVIAISLGGLLYLLPAVLGPLLPMHLRKRVGNFYYEQAMRSFRQVAIVRRILGGYELLPIGVDDEEKLAQVTLSSGIIGGDKKLPFKDPDNRIKRLYAKPVAVVIEEVPAAIDAELAELGYWVRQHELENGIERGGSVDPYFAMSDGLRVIDPLDLLNLVSKDVEPENVETTRQLTEKRFEEYGNRVGMAETVGTLTGFGFGLGGIAAIQYLQTEILDGQGGGSQPTNPLPPMGGDLAPPVDVVVSHAYVAVDAITVIPA